MLALEDLTLSGLPSGFCGIFNRHHQDKPSQIDRSATSSVWERAYGKMFLCEEHPSHHSHVVKCFDCLQRRSTNFRDFTSISGYRRWRRRPRARSPAVKMMSRNGRKKLVSSVERSRTMVYGACGRSLLFGLAAVRHLLLCGELNDSGHYTIYYQFTNW